jgi:hypothetical protein
MNLKQICTALVVAAVAAGALGAPSTSAAADGAARQRAGAYEPTLKTSDHQVLVDKKVVLRGTVKPAIKGGTVIIQKRIAGRKWTAEARTTMSRAGRFSYTDRPSAAGVRNYRAVVPKDKKHQAGRSAPVTVTVMRWQPLSAIHRAVWRNTSRVPSLRINGVTYRRGFVGSSVRQRGSNEWDLDRACTTFKGRFGESDASDTYATSHIEVQGDGDPLYSRDFALTESEPTTIDITGVFRLVFAWTGSNPEARPTAPPGASAALAEPQVLCAF